MSDCDSIKLRKVLFEIISQESDFAGAPLVVVIRKLSDRLFEVDDNCTEQDIIETIQLALDKWLIDKTIAYLSKERGIEYGVPPGEPQWHLKILSSEKTKWYQNLKPIEKALIKLLRQQNNPDRLGQILIEHAREHLVVQGFQSDDVDHIWIEDMIISYFSYYENEDMEWYGLVEEYHKTDEYKKEMKCMMDKAIEKEIRYMQLVEELDGEDEDKDK